MLSTTPLSIPATLATAEQHVALDLIATAAIAPIAAGEALVVPTIADAIPELSPADRAFLFAIGGVVEAAAAAPRPSAAMNVALAARPPEVAAPVMVADAAPAAPEATDFDPDAPIAFVEPEGTEDIEAPFRALINPLARPENTVNWPDPETDHDWVANPIPESARSAAEVRCMADAIYFEARSEPVRGQLAVAQVVINRLKNPAYPGTVCGVVYQNQHMRNACQFSFACDGRREVVTDPDSWRIANQIAIAVLNGDAIWLDEVGAATHYHAVYVRPAWARQMQRMAQIGLHIFYRTYGGGWI